MAKKPKAPNVETIAGDTQEPEQTQDSKGRVVIWTKLGEERRAKSEHGFHKEGEEVSTEHAEHFIKHGFAVEG